MSEAPGSRYQLARVVGPPATGSRFWSLDFVRRSSMVSLGLVIFGYGITMTLGAGLGLSPWDVLHQGISLHTPLSFGQSSAAVSVLIVLGSYLLRMRPGVATILNALLVGASIDFFLATGLTLDAREGPLALRLSLLLGGLAVVGIGSALYIKPLLGAGPRDSLMLAVSHRTGLRIALVRGALETTALAVGFLLGGTVGVGTLVFALGIGPSVDLSFRLLGVSHPVGGTIEN